MKLLFVADPLEAFKTYKDTTFAMMREAARRGHELLACEPRDLVWQRGGRVSAHGARDRARPAPSGATGSSRRGRRAASIALADFDAVLMRKDPPFDSEYFYATHLLEQAEREGARVFNQPRGAARPSRRSSRSSSSRSSSRRRSSRATPTAMRALPRRAPATSS